MSTSTSSPSSRLRLAPHSSPISASEVARNSIISSSAKGWSPLQINKRDSINQSPLKPSLSPDPNAPRRSSSSFKHVSKNSLVSNSPFKSPTTVQGAQAAGLDLGKSTDQIIHERRTAARAFGELPSSAKGVGTTSKAAIGLGIGISPSKQRSTSRSTSGSNSNGSAINGQRKVSIEKPKVAFPGIERRSSTERRVSASKENESPDVRASKRVPRSSMGFKDLAKGTLVTKSPFKRVPSVGGLSSTSSSKANESPSHTDNEIGPSPKSIPIEKDDVFSSPSPRRTSASKQQQQRRASPSASLGVGSRKSVSPTPSPPRSVAQPLLTATTGSAGPSPLSRSLSIPSIEPTPTPTPHKSAMTPSRRLRGPRDLSAGLESPTRKTVTFQSVPDVKEFETMSAEPSMDGSFEVNNHDDEEEDGWVDESVNMSLKLSMARENSLDELLSDAQPIFESSADASPVFTEENDGQMPEDSTTANFMDTLIEEGLFSPPTMDTPAFEDQAAFELPLEPVDGDSDRPFLATPSLGGSVHASPLLASGMFGETDSAGIPYGRTHHAERAAIAHSLSPVKPASPIEQPDIPRDEDHNMLLNANAAQPAVPIPQSPVHYPEYNDPFASASNPHAHQVGAIPDPFITIQTATKVLPIQHNEREEDGIPLGRTSHAERLQARRMLATQSLGLGMPRSPAISQGLTRQYSEEEPSGEELQGEQSDTMEPIQAPVLAPPVVRTASQESEEGTKRRLPKIPAPAPMPVDIPSPVTSPNKNEDPDKLTVAEKRTSKFDISGFSLPFIGSTSPFFNSAPATFEKQPSIDGHSTSSNEPERPLTPPPVIRDTAEDKQESPHRIPDMNFHFEEIQLQRTTSDELKRTATVKSNPVGTIKVSNELKKDSPIKEVSRRSLSTSSSLGKLPTSGSGTSIKNDFGSPSSNKSQDSTTTRVRQRISREMIRETINQRIADGSLSRRPASSGDLSKSLPVSFAVPDMTIRQRRTSGVDKDLPPPPQNESPAMTSSSSKAEELAPRMSKAHTTDNAASNSSEMRPAMRPRSQTQSAHEVLKQNEKDGILNEPKSALDKLASSLPSPTESGTTLQREVSGSIAAEMPPPPGRPISILRNPYPNPNKQEGLLPPVDVGVFSSKEKSSSPSSTSEGRKGREDAIIAKRKEKQQERNVSGVSTGSRRSRRSLSMGDVDKEAEQAKEFRRKNTRGNPRLTLGIDADQQSILDAFREEITQMDRGYKVREKAVVRASYQDKVRHNKAGDIDTGKAWKQLRRPSDMNEHAAEIRAMRARESTSGKASGTIFVKVLGVEGLQIPLPDQPTYFCITLDNGIDYIRTPYSVLGEGAKVNQEFSLVEHPNFEFSLSLDIRRDPHILKMLHQKPEVPAPVPVIKRPQTPSSPAHKSGGFRSLFASPRKPKASKDPRSTTPQPILPTLANSNIASAKPVDNIVKYLASPSGSTIAKTHIAFKPIAKNCESRVLEIRYPMFAMFKGEPDRSREPQTPQTPMSTSTAGSSGSNGQSRKQLAKITLQIFRLPPIPGLKGEELPQCIDEALRGMRHHAWHEHEYHEGVLTQEGGDCNMPKRRLFKLIGGNLVAINEVTKKEVTKVDLRQAISVIDLNAQDNGTPKSRMTMRPRSSDEGLSVRPRSFMVEFKDGEGITFSADNDKSKEVWMQTLEGLIGKIPSNPLWAELLATRQRERAARRTASSTSLARDAKRQASSSGQGRPVSMPLGAPSKTR